MLALLIQIRREIWKKSKMAEIQGSEAKMTFACAASVCLITHFF
jgi:hypothetical protein